MIVTELTVPVERSNNVQDHGFTIKATGKAFDILSSGLYSDKILAIVRELSCNAYDAHVEAGKKDTPIEIKLPSTLDPTFYVKDYGVGLDDHQVLTLYTTYFDSTKQFSNEFIGALGLGSKSPFSYVSTFNVESRFNGIKRIYSCFKNEHNLPTIAKLEEQPTDEPNGLTVMLSSRKDDVGKWINAAKKAFMYFNPIPHVIGWDDFEPYFMKHTVTGSNWNIRESDYYAQMKGPHVIQGFVVYPIDGSILREHGLSEPAIALTTVDIDFTVPIGHVEVAASREALSYDARTITNLCNIFEKAATEIRDSFQHSFDACTTQWDMCVLYSELNSHPSTEFRKLFASLHKDDPFTWENTNVSDKFSPNLSDVKHTLIKTYGAPARRSSKRASLHKSWSPGTLSLDLFVTKVHKNVHLLIDRQCVGTLAVLGKYIDGMPSNDSDKEPLIIVLRPSSKKNIDEREVQSMIERFGTPTVVDVSTLVEPKEKRERISSYTKRDKTLRRVWNGFLTKRTKYGSSRVNRTFSPRCWIYRTSDELEHCLYVDVDKNMALRNGHEFTSIDSVIEYATNLGILSPGQFVFGLTKKEMEKVPTDQHWENLFDHVIMKFYELDYEHHVTSNAQVEQFFGNIGKGFVTYYIQNWLNVADRVNDGLFKQAMIKFDSMYEDAHKYSNKDVNGLRNALTINVTHASTISQELNQLWNDILIRYPILNLVNLNYMDTKSGAMLVDYINLVDPVDIIDEI